MLLQLGLVMVLGSLLNRLLMGQDMFEEFGVKPACMHMIIATKIWCVNCVTFDLTAPVLKQTGRSERPKDGDRGKTYPHPHPFWGVAVSGRRQIMYTQFL